MPRSSINTSQDTNQASKLFDRSPSQEYIKEWTESLTQPESDQEALNALSVLVFRLGQEWLALPTIFFKEITNRRPVHHIPHRSGIILQGVVNLNGELELYVALHELLHIEPADTKNLERLPYHGDRMMAIIKEGELWVFPVDEIDGIYGWNLSGLENVPVNISKSGVNYIKGIMKMDSKSVGLLDEELLFASLQRSLQ